jgi:hypothetical protein
VTCPLGGGRAILCATGAKLGQAAIVTVGKPRDERKFLRRASHLWSGVGLSLNRSFPSGRSKDRAEAMFRKAVILLLLMVTPFAQARAVMVCSMTDGPVVERCVCPEDHHRSMSAHHAHGEQSSSCCTFVLEVSKREFVAPAVEAAKQLPTKRAWDDVPVVTLLPTPAVVAAPGVPPSPRLMRSPDPDPDRLYLRTARLRL